MVVKQSISAPAAGRGRSLAESPRLLQFLRAVYLPKRRRLCCTLRLKGVRPASAIRYARPNPVSVRLCDAGLGPTAGSQSAHHWRARVVWAASSVRFMAQADSCEAASFSATIRCISLRSRAAGVGPAIHIRVMRSAITWGAIQPMVAAFFAAERAVLRLATTISPLSSRTACDRGGGAKFPPARAQGGNRGLTDCRRGGATLQCNRIALFSVRAPVPALP